MAKHISSESPPVATQLLNPIYSDDLLESILSHAPFPDLVAASHVSAPWKRCVSSSLRYINPPKPWLVLHKQTTDRPPYYTSVHAYDPRSRVWYDITRAKETNMDEVVYFSTLRSSSSRVLYMLSPSRFSLSLDDDPLHVAAWRHVEPPRMWRINPVVAVVGGRYVVVAGGTFDFEDDPLGVEVYDLVETKQWEMSESMPWDFKGSSSSTWLSIAAGTDHLYVTEKRSGVTYKFDPRSKDWLGPYTINRRHDDTNDSLCCCAIGFCGSRLMMVGMTRSDGQERITRVELYELDDRSLEIKRTTGEMMPREMVERFECEASSAWSSVSVSFAGDSVYVVNCLAPKEVFFCEVGAWGCGEWGSVENPLGSKDDCSWLKERLVFTCSDVRLGDLTRAIVRDNCKFTVR